MNTKAILRGIRSAVSIKTAVTSGFRTVPAPLFMVWESTYDCNLHCSHCYLDGHRAEEGRYLDTGEIKEIIRESARLGLFCLVITGGEPLLRDDVFDVRAFASRLGLFVSLTTNGTLIDGTNVGEVSRFDHVTISVDSMHETSYGESSGTASPYFPRLADAIRTIREMSPRTVVNVQTVIDEDNWVHLLDINRRFYPAAADTVFQLRYGAGFDIVRSRWDAMVRDMRFRDRKLGWIQKRFLKLFPPISRGDLVSPCLALTSNFVVSPDGYLMPCNYRRERITDLRRGVGISRAWNDLGGLRRLYSSEKRGCTCANTCFVAPAMLLS